MTAPKSKWDRVKTNLTIAWFQASWIGAILFDLLLAVSYIIFTIQLLTAITNVAQLHLYGWNPLSEDFMVQENMTKNLNVGLIPASDVFGKKGSGGPSPIPAIRGLFGSKKVPTTTVHSEIGLSPPPASVSSSSEDLRHNVILITLINYLTYFLNEVVVKNVPLLVEKVKEVVD